MKNKKMITMNTIDRDTKNRSQSSTIGNTLLVERNDIGSDDKRDAESEGFMNGRQKRPHPDRPLSMQHLHKGTEIN